MSWSLESATHVSFRFFGKTSKAEVGRRISVLDLNELEAVRVDGDEERAGLNVDQQLWAGRASRTTI